ncbi:MAG: hypothetical protein ACE5JG_12540 [Planctomycetota bacterium]
MGIRAAVVPALLLAAACAATRTWTRTRAPGPESDRGRTLYETSCQRCHSLYMPRSYTAAEWKRYVRKYGAKARLRRHDRTLVYAYLRKHAREG